MMQRGFVHLREAWYGDANLSDHRDHLVDEVMIGNYTDEGGTEGEFRVAWYNLRDGRPPSPRLEIFMDGMPTAMEEFYEVLVWLGAHAYDFQPTELCGMLRACNITDLTPHEPPKQ